MQRCVPFSKELLIALPLSTLEFESIEVASGNFLVSGCRRVLRQREHPLPHQPFEPWDRQAAHLRIQSSHARASALLRTWIKCPSLCEALGCSRQSQSNCYSGRTGSETRTLFFLRSRAGFTGSQLMLLRGFQL